MRDSERSFCLAYGIWLFGVFAYFVPAATWNPVSRFDLTRAIVEERTVSIDSWADDTGDRAFSSGHWYTDKAPVPSVLAVPAYAIVRASQLVRGERPDYSVFATPETPALRVTVNGAFQRGLYVCGLFTAGLGTALAGVLLFQLLRDRFGARAALVGSAGSILATPLLPYATSFYGHALAGTFLVAALAALFSTPGVPAGPRRTQIAGACLALAVGSEYLTLVAAVAIVGVLLAARGKDAARALLHLAVGGALPVLLIAAYHTRCFGAPWKTGYSFIVRPEFARGHASGLLGLHLPTAAGLAGLSFGGSRGLFFLAPASALAAAFGAVRAFRDRDEGARAGVLAFTALLLANAGYYMWWGGAAAGPRHLVPAVGGLAFGLAAAWNSRLRPALVVLLAISLVNMLVLTAVGLEAPDHGNALFDYAYPRFLRGDLAALSGASNLGIRLGLVRGATLGPVIVWIVLGARFLFRHAEDWAGERRREIAQVGALAESAPPA